VLTHTVATHTVMTHTVMTHTVMTHTAMTHTARMEPQGTRRKSRLTERHTDERLVSCDR